MNLVYRKAAVVTVFAATMFAASASDAGWDAGWGNEDRATLMVRSDGEIGLGEACPERRWIQSYSDLRAAIGCARDGDKIRLLRGDIFAGGSEGPYGTIVLDKNLGFDGAHRIGDTMAVIFARFEVRAEVEFDGVMIMKDSRSPLETHGGLIETASAGARVKIVGSHLAGGEAHEGGAIMVAEGTEVTVEYSSLTGNSAILGPGGAVSNKGTLTIHESEIFGNSADYGGGIYNAGKLVLNASVIAGNTALSTGGGIASDNAEVFLWNRSLVGGNKPDDCAACN